MNKVAVVTGGSRGIGAAIARELAHRGMRLALLCSKDVAGASKLASEIHGPAGDALVLQADVADPGQIDRAFDEIASRFGRVDVLVNNAGISGSSPLNEVTWEFASRVLDVNLKGALFCARRAEQLFPAEGGAIINVSSAIASQPLAGQAVYAASKAGLEAMTRVLAHELGPKRIRVNAVAPGPVETDLLPLDDNVRAYIGSRTPLTRVGQPEDVAKVVAFLADSDAGWITGQVVCVDGGFRT